MTLLLLAQLTAPALAYQLNNFIWAPDQMPITWTMTDYLEDSLPQTVSNETNRYPQEDLAIKSFCNWHWTEYCDANVPSDWVVHEDAACAEFSFEYGGIDPGNEGPTGNGRTKFYWDDPQNIQGAGNLGTTYLRSTGTLIKEVNNVYLYSIYDSDISMNDEVEWDLAHEVEAGCSGSTYNAEEVMTHEVGHLLGLGHSCEQDELCADEALKVATMYWEGGPCATASSSINSDDEDGLNALYGPFITFETEDARTGVAPLTVCFTSVAEDETFAELASQEWRFGDGTTSTELNPCHTWTEQGQYTVSVTFLGESDLCGEWDYAERELGFVLVCEVPEPSFEAESSDGLLWQTVNNTVVDTYGCVDSVQWDVYKGGSASGEPVLSLNAWSPKLDFPEEGTYTVVLTAGGPAGEATEQLQVEVSARACSTAPGASGVVGLLLAAAALTRRRR